jgi:protein O-mannosyl-transferase
MAKNKQTPKAVPATAKPVSEPKRPVVSAQSGMKVLAGHWYIVILVAVAFLVNAATINNGYTLDDPFFTRENPLVKQGTASIPEFFKHAAYYGVFKNHDASYRPFMLISFAIEKQLVGDFSAKVGHLVNLLLFCGQIIALFVLLRRVFNKYSVYVPFFIVLLFELHPIHTEVVASIKSRDEILALLFTSLCMLQSFKYIDTNKMLHFILSGVYFFCALMCKETPICFVAIVPLTIYFFRDAKVKHIATAVAPYLVVAAVYMAMRMAFIESDGQKVVILTNNNALMAATTYADKLATALYIQLKYIMLLVYPHPLSYDYSYNQIPIIGFANIKAISAVVVLGALIFYAFKNLKKKDVFSYSILFYAALVALTANILVDIGATMAERFVYMASLGYCIALVFLIGKLLKVDLVTPSPPNASKAFTVFIAIAAMYGVKTFARNADWKDNMTLYESGIQTAPDSWRANNLLGSEYTKLINSEKDPALKMEYYHKAVYHLGRSIEILPSPEALVLKGFAYIFGGQDDSAAMCYRLVLKADPMNHGAVNNMGSIYLRKSMFDSAIRMLEPYALKDSTQTDILGNLAAAYGNSGNLQKAIYYYQMALRIEPNQPPNVFSSLTNIYRILGDSAKTQYYNQLLIKSQQKPQ